MEQQNTAYVEKKVRRVPPPIMAGAILCTIPQAAATISRSERFIYEALADGRLKGVKSDGRTLVVVESIHAYVAGLPPVQVKAMYRPPQQLQRRQQIPVANGNRKKQRAPRSAAAVPL